MDIQNPEKIEIEGLRTIHKLCKFGAEHNMEGCSFTEIVERMFDELNAKAQAVPEGFVLVPKEPTKEMIHIGESTHYGYDNIDSKHCYIAMIEAAQEPAND